MTRSYIRQRLHRLEKAIEKIPTPQRKHTSLWDLLALDPQAPDEDWKAIWDQLDDSTKAAIQDADAYQEDIIEKNLQTEIAKLEEGTSPKAPSEYRPRKTKTPGF